MTWKSLLSTQSKKKKLKVTGRQHRKKQNVFLFMDVFFQVRTQF